MHSYPNTQRKRKTTLVWCLVVAVIFLVPLCIGVSLFWLGESNYGSVDQIWNPSVKKFMPPAATEITVRTELNGHFSRYTISEKDFHDFLNSLWDDQKDTSAHQRETMSGEGEAADQQEMELRFQSVGWEPLKNAVRYYSPSKNSGAMTTYYYDREAGTAYHDAGYW